MEILDVQCPSCRQTHTLLEGSKNFQQYKDGKTTRFYCEDCKHKIRIESMKQQYKD